MEPDLKDQIRDLIDCGAQPVSLREISERRRARQPSRAPGRRRAIFTGAGVGLAAAGCAAGLVIAPPPPAPRRLPRRPAPPPPSQGATFVTAAMIKHVASASSSALASSGQERSAIGA